MSRFADHNRRSVDRDPAGHTGRPMVCMTEFIATEFFSARFYFSHNLSFWVRRAPVTWRGACFGISYNRKMPGSEVLTDAMQRNIPE